MEVIQSNEHIRRIEQPVYKRQLASQSQDEKNSRMPMNGSFSKKPILVREHHKRPVEVGAWANALWKMNVSVPVRKRSTP